MVKSSLDLIFRELTFKEREKPAHIEFRHKFTESYKTEQRPNANPGNFMPDELTPEWELYEDEDGQECYNYAPPEYHKPTPEANDNYANVNIMLLGGREISRGQVPGHKRDIYGNTTRQLSDNPILDTQEYTVQFEDV